MKALRLSWMAAPLLFVGACADIGGDDGARHGARGCRSKVEAKTSPSTELPVRLPPTPPGPRNATAPDSGSEPAPCGDPGDDAQHVKLWDGTGRSEAVRGA
jgi:hypothetical protein